MVTHNKLGFENNDLSDNVSKDFNIGQRPP